MVYIIQNRMIWILYDDRKFREYFIPQYFPSWREEPRWKKKSTTSAT